MLKTASGGSTTGQLNYQGTWNANTNSPTLASGTGTKNNYYVVSVAGTTTLDGISSWSVGDWAIFNGTVWERVLGGTTESFANVSITTATGYLYANNTANVTASLTIPNSGLANSNVIIGNVTIALGSSTANLANLTLANVIIQSGTIPSANLSSNSVVIGNTTVALGSTVTSLGNVTLTNTTISSVATTFPNNFLSNSSATLGNATITLGGTTSNVGNLTLANVTIQSGTFPSGNLSANSATIGNTVVALGSTVSTLGNVTMANVTITTGTINVTSTNVAATTAASATFSNSSMMLVPAGYIDVDLNGTVVKVPYYAV